MRKERAWKNYGGKFSQLQDIRGRETGINIDTRFMQLKVPGAKLHSWIPLPILLVLLRRRDKLPIVSHQSWGDKGDLTRALFSLF